jgi:hypothetical protein
MVKVFESHFVTSSPALLSLYIAYYTAQNGAILGSGDHRLRGCPKYSLQPLLTNVKQSKALATNEAYQPVFMRAESLRDWEETGG